MALLENIFAEQWLLIAICSFVYIGFLTRKYHRLSQFSGPTGTGWSEIPHSYAIITWKSDVWYKSVTDRYGSIARIGPNDLVTSSPELLAHMSAVRSPYTRTAWYNRAIRTEPGRDHVFSQLDEEKHTKRRQQLAGGYSGKENTDLEPTIDKHVGQMLDLIRREYLSIPSIYRTMNLAQKVQYLTLDVISDIGFGQAFGHLSSDSDVNDYIKSTESALFAMTFMVASGLTPILQWPPIARRIGFSEKAESGIGKSLATARKLIDDRLKNGTDKRSDMLAAFIRHGLHKDDLLSETWLQIIAGSETTATAIRWTMMYIMANPRVYAKLQREIDETVAKGHAPSIVPDAVARELEYLQAVLREGFRIHPPVTDIVPKCVPRSGDTVVVEGKTIHLPGGTNISYSVLALQSRTDIFGEDALQFRPERWIIHPNGDNADHVAHMKRTTEMIFGYGKYQCLGKNIAWMEYGKVIFELLRNFDFAIAKPEDGYKEPSVKGLYIAKDLRVVVTARY